MAAPRRAGAWAPAVSRMSRWQRLWDPFWSVPLALAAASVLFGLLLPQLDGVLGPAVPMLFQGGPDGARSVLGAITSAMISVTGLVFSVTLVVLQLASSQFTPRVLGTFLDSRVSQATLGVFVGTFLYALTVLRSVRGGGAGTPPFVPQVATGAAFVGVIASVGLFLAFIHHITTSIQVSIVIARTAAATGATMDRMMPQDIDPGEVAWDPAAAGYRRPLSVRASDGIGDRYLVEVDYRQLVRIARESRAVVQIVRQVGEYVPRGSELARIWTREGDAGSVEDLVHVVHSHFSADRERSMRHDVAFGIRQLVDIAERALSPGINDPTTATQVIDGIHSILRRAVQREAANSCVLDDDGAVRLVYRPQTVEQLVELGVVEVAHWGRGSVQVPRALRVMLDDLRAVALPRYHARIDALRADLPTPGPPA